MGDLLSDLDELTGKSNPVEVIDIEAPMPTPPQVKGGQQQQPQQQKNFPPAKLENVPLRSDTVVAAVDNTKGADGSFSLTGEDFEEVLQNLLEKDLQIALHDRQMSNALLKLHLKRGDELDKLSISMPVASVIADNTGATLKSLELTIRNGERIHKIAELLVSAKKSQDASALAALKVKSANDDGWTSDEPPP